MAEAAHMMSAKDPVQELVQRRMAVLGQAGRLSNVGKTSAVPGVKNG